MCFNLDVISILPILSFGPSLIVRILKKGVHINRIAALFSVQEELREPVKLLELAVTWNCVDGAHDIFQRIQVVDDVFL
jgi:hypothetical protein